eukprot:5460451-Amphidinium_carterae.1
MVLGSPSYVLLTLVLLLSCHSLSICPRRRTKSKGTQTAMPAKDTSSDLRPPNPQSSKNQAVVQNFSFRGVTISITCHNMSKNAPVTQQSPLTTIPSASSRQKVSEFAMDATSIGKVLPKSQAQQKLTQTRQSLKAPKTPKTKKTPQKHPGKYTASASEI